MRPRDEEPTLVSRREDVAPHARTETVGERNARIAAKMRRAERMLGRLPASDRRSRLLCAAILRRDEVLLDAVMRSTG